MRDTVGAAVGCRRRARRSSAAVWLLCAATTSTLAAEGRFGYLGLAPAVAGETQAQAETRIGAPLAPLAGQPPKPEGACQPRAVASQPGVVYTVDKGVVARVETRDARYATVSGVRVGDDVAKARRIYGKRLAAQPHPYFERGVTLVLYSPDRRHALVLEGDDRGRIVTLRGGLVPAVEFLEGCSAAGPSR